MHCRKRERNNGKRAAFHVSDMRDKHRCIAVYLSSKEP